MTPQSKVVQMPSRQTGMRAFMFYIDDWRSSWQVEAMDDHEKVAYLNLLMKAASEPDCGLPDDDYALAVISGLGRKWFRPTPSRDKRLKAEDQTGATPQKPIFKTCGEKLRECFSFRPNTGQCFPDRLYNDRLYREYLHKQQVSAERSRARTGKTRPSDTEQLLSFDGSEVAPETTNDPQTTHQPPPYNSSTREVYEVNPPPPTTEEQPEVVVGSPSQSPDIADSEYQAIAQRAINLGMAKPGRALCADIRRKFSGCDIAIVITNLPRFPDQTGPGLWGYKTREELMLETKRQQTTPADEKAMRKENARQEAERRLTEWAREQDRKRSHQK